MTILHPSPIPASQLTWDAKTGTFTGEISEIGGFGPVYDDACDEGLTLVSQRESAEIVFVIEHEERDSERDILYWDLLPANLSLRSQVPFRVRIFND
jgi:hypothetical protein